MVWVAFGPSRSKSLPCFHISTSFPTPVCQLIKITEYLLPKQVGLLSSPYGLSAAPRQSACDVCLSITCHTQFLWVRFFCCLCTHFTDSERLLISRWATDRRQCRAPFSRASVEVQTTNLFQMITRPPIFTIQASIRRMETTRAPNFV
jgi:hypothetical protein